MLVIEILFSNKSIKELNIGNNYLDHDGIIVYIYIYKEI